MGVSISQLNLRSALIPKESTEWPKNLRQTYGFISTPQSKSKTNIRRHIKWQPCFHIPRAMARMPCHLKEALLYLFRYSLKCLIFFLSRAFQRPFGCLLDGIWMQFFFRPFCHAAIFMPKTVTIVQFLLQNRHTRLNDYYLFVLKDNFR